MLQLSCGMLQFSYGVRSLPVDPEDFNFTMPDNKNGVAASASDLPHLLPDLITFYLPGVLANRNALTCLYCGLFVPYTDRT